MARKGNDTPTGTDPRPGALGWLAGLTTDTPPEVYAVRESHLASQVESCACVASWSAAQTTLAMAELGSEKENTFIIAV